MQKRKYFTAADLEGPWINISDRPSKEGSQVQVQHHDEPQPRLQPRLQPPRSLPGPHIQSHILAEEPITRRSPRTRVLPRRFSQESFSQEDTRAVNAERETKDALAYIARAMSLDEKGKRERKAYAELMKLYAIQDRLQQQIHAHLTEGTPLDRTWRVRNRDVKQKITRALDLLEGGHRPSERLKKSWEIVGSRP